MRIHDLMDRYKCCYHSLSNITASLASCLCWEDGVGVVHSVAILSDQDSEATYFLVVDLVSSGGVAKCDLLGIGKGWGEASLSHHKNQYQGFVFSGRISWSERTTPIFENAFLTFDLIDINITIVCVVLSEQKKVKLWCSSCCILYVFQIKIVGRSWSWPVFLTKLVLFYSNSVLMKSDM